jgi:DNA-binding NtrC family response regulator
LSVVPIWLPPLRERPGDVERLARHFCATLGAANGKPRAEISADAVERLAAQRWPGNVRELQNFVERLIVLSDGPRIERADVERELSRGAAPLAAAPAGTLEDRRLATELDALHDALRRAAGNRSLAARLLGISRRTLYTKLAEHGLMRS